MKLNKSYKKLMVVSFILCVALFTNLIGVKNLGAVIFDPWECTRLLIPLS